jgi:hypothetical protein
MPPWHHSRPLKNKLPDGQREIDHKRHRQQQMPADPEEENPQLDKQDLAYRR